MGALWFSARSIGFLWFKKFPEYESFCAREFGDLFSEKLNIKIEDKDLCKILFSH